MYPKIGVAAIIQDSTGRILISKRVANHGNGLYGFPGGHLELSETILECATRETQEETGILIKKSKILTFTEDIFSTEKHYITFFVLVLEYEGIPEIMEIHKNEEWKWYEWDNLPEPLFLPIIHLKEKITSL